MYGNTGENTVTVMNHILLIIFLTITFQGPPPDPSYNFLSDRSREGMQHKQQERSDRREPPRRHPKNFGGQDFSNVKNQMKNVKERQVSYSQWN